MEKYRGADGKKKKKKGKERDVKGKVHIWMAVN